MKKIFLGLITRCKDEFYIKEFVDYYLNEGVDNIFILDDNSNNKSIYDNIESNSVKILYCNFGPDKRKIPDKFYKKIRLNYKWLIYVDVDEFITTKKNLSNTIRDELETTFKDVDCIKIPWVMMSCNKRKKNPEKILLEIVHRMNQDKKHKRVYTNHEKWLKFKCKYNSIEVKCIFKPEKFLSLWDHYPYDEVNEYCKIINSIDLKTEKLENIDYDNFKKEEIKNGYLLCYHYRLISQENCLNKIKNNIWYKNFSLNDIMNTDYPELNDFTIKDKILSKRKTFVIGFNKLTSYILHDFFMKNKIKSINSDNNNLVELFNQNISNGKKLLENGRTKNILLNSNCEYEEASFFSDIIHNNQSIEYYQLLYEQYPNSKFILNLPNLKDLSINKIKTYFTGFIIEKNETVLSWIKKYENKMNEIKIFFKDKENSLLIFNIEKDRISKIIKFLDNYYLLDRKLFEINEFYQNITSD